MRVSRFLKPFNCNAVTIYVNIGRTVFAGVCGSILWRVHLTNGTAYTFTLTAADTSGNKGEGVSSEALTPPGKVTGLAATAGNGKVRLIWTDPGDADLASIEITFSPGKTGVTQPVSVAKAVRLAVIDGLDNNTDYTFTVKAKDTAGNLSAGETATAKPESTLNSDLTPPAKVGGLAVDAAATTATSVTLTWTDPADPDLASIEITWEPNGSTPQTVSTGTGTYTATGLTKGTEYTFTVKAKDSAGNLSAGETATAKPETTLNSDLTPPGPVTGLAAQAGATSVTLTWTDPADSDLASIEITWTPPEGTDSGSKSVTGGTQTYTATGLTKGTAYTFTVKAKDNATPTANESSAETVSATPREPTAQVTVTFIGPEDETITLTGAERTLSQAANTPIAITVTGAYDAYRWALDNSIITGETGSSLTGSAGSLEVKRHTLTVFVTKGGVEYAKRVTFTVTN